MIPVDSEGLTIIGLHRVTIKEVKLFDDVFEIAYEIVPGIPPQEPNWHPYVWELTAFDDVGTRYEEVSGGMGIGPDAMTPGTRTVRPSPPAVASTLTLVIRTSPFHPTAPRTPVGEVRLRLNASI